MNNGSNIVRGHSGLLYAFSLLNPIKDGLELQCWQISGIGTSLTPIVAGLTSIDLPLRVRPFVGKYSRILEAAALDSLKTRQNLAPAPSLVFDPNQSNKRRVKKGSDPIHNRC
ncbi:hypothetical protein F3Y22_tig00019423pilonHSYRG00016 [Hibiscus syriacus]|uniref:Uncharacterized protein n=1 Tax=Hibiscus syriacus TaxID=106335 RepID=A0A6A3BZN1_HIBSY|nr:hypothetical protein F3Y22_tig00019423pilonHSYRG00016 [Hibiscus syriacus]